MPCLLVENKVDLLEKEELEDPSLQEFVQRGNFIGSFRVSAKTNLNISESMEFLLKNIIQRMENMKNIGEFTNQRKKVSLNPGNTQTSKRKNNESCC